jgi:hypothetical protein
MKGKIRGIVALLAVLLLVATLAPLANTGSATAAPSLDTWEAVTTPSATGNVISQCDVTDMAVAPDGMTIYVCDAQGSRFLKSVDGGHCFDDITAGLVDAGYVGPPRLVAVAPNASEAVAVVDSAAATATSAMGRVFISNTSGMSWDPLPLTPDANSNASNTRVTDLDVGPARDTAHPDLGRDFLVCTVDDAAGAMNDADIFVIGQTTAWCSCQNAGTYAANTFDFTSVTFTPGFLGDRVIAAVGSKVAGGVPAGAGTYLLLINLGAAWGCSTAAYTPLPGMPVPIQAEPIDFDATFAAAKSIISSDIALPSDFYPIEDYGQKTFVALAAVGALTTPMGCDVFRVDYVTVTKLGIAPDVDIHSISYRGELSGGYLIAGATSLTTFNHVQTWCTDDPMWAFPTWLSSAKPPTGTANAIVAFSPDFAISNKVFAGTSDGGANRESAFSVSCCAFTPDCPCACFNQWSLIDTTIHGMSDVMPTPDGTEIFLATWNSAGADLESLWKSPLPATACSWERVRISLADWGDTSGDTLVRLNPDYANFPVIYWCDRGNINIQYSDDGGCCFATRTAPSNIQDVTVEDLDTLYMASGADVYRSDTAAFTWGSGVSAGFATIIWTIAMAPSYPNLPVPGHVLVGGINGEVANSINGGVSFTPLFPFLDVGGNVQVAGDTHYDGTTNNFIYAGSGSGNVYRFDISTYTSWELINSTIASVSGLAVCECLYAANATPGGGADRTRNPTAVTPLWVHLTAGLSGGEIFNAPPSALRCSSVPDDASYVALFAIDTASATLYEYIDTECKEFEAPFIYSIKFLCGKGTDSFGVKPANYATAINIHNFLDEEVLLRKKVVIAHREDEPVGIVTEYFELSLGPNKAVEVDCIDIYGLLGGVTSAFIKGFVVIESSKPLNIVAVYTVESRPWWYWWWREVNIDVEQISPVVSP